MKTVISQLSMSTVARLCLMTLLLSNALLSLQEMQSGCWEETYEAGGPYEADLDSVLKKVTSEACNQGITFSHEGEYVKGDAYSRFTEPTDCFACMEEADIKERCLLRVGGWVQMASCGVRYAPIGA